MLQTRDLEMNAGRTTVSEASRTYFGVNSALGRCEQTYRMKNQLVTPPDMLCRMSRCKSRALPATFQLTHNTLYSFPLVFLKENDHFDPSPRNFFACGAH